MLAAVDPRRAWRSPRLLLLRELPGVHRELTALSVVAVLLTAVMPTATTLASGALVGAVPAAVKNGLDSPQGRHLLRALAVLAAVYTFQFAVLPLFNQASSALSRRLDRSLSERVMAAILAPTGIRHLEEPEILDEVTKAEGLVTGYTPGGAVRGMVGIWSIRLGAIGGVALVARFSWLLAIGLAAVAIVEQRFWRKRFDEVTASIFDRGDRHRRSNYLRDTVLTPVAAKEVRVFGLQPWFARRFHSSWDEVMVPVWKEMRGNRMKSAAAAILPPAAIVSALALITSAALDGRIDLTALVVLTQAVFTISNLGAVGDQDEMISRGVAALPVALALEKRLRGPEFVASGSADPAGLPRQVIRFEKVAFRYPGRDADVYDGLDLEIPAGRSLAVVGENGAGKTTLVKLLARMYEPTSGRITVDGVDVRELDPAKWQTRIAAIFQDFRRYHLPARDNVAFGAPDIADDQDALERSARRAGVLDLIEGLDAGWDTPLDRQLTGGTDLSGGQCSASRWPERSSPSKAGPGCSSSTNRRPASTFAPSPSSTSASSISPPG